MTGIDISVSVEHAQKMLKAVDKGITLDKMLKMVGIEHLQWVDKNFENQGTEKKWAPLSGRTILARRKGKKKRLGTKILIDTGDLRKSFLYPGGVLKRGYNFITVGTTKEYASTHEFGDSGRHVPQRKILPKDKTAETLAQKILQAYVDKVTKDAGT